MFILERLGTFKKIWEGPLRFSPIFPVGRGKKEGNFNFRAFPQPNPPSGPKPYIKGFLGRFPQIIPFKGLNSPLGLPSFRGIPSPFGLP